MTSKVICEADRRISQRDESRNRLNQRRDHEALCTAQGVVHSIVNIKKSGTCIAIMHWLK